MPRPALALAAVLALVAALLVWCGAAGSNDDAAERGALYTANLRSSDISAIDLATGRETARIPVADNPHELARTSAGLLVSNYRSGAVTILGSAFGVARSGLGAAPSDSEPETQNAELPLGGEPHGLAVAGGRIAVTLGRAGAVALLDARTGEVIGRVETGGEPHMAGPTPPAPLPKGKGETDASSNTQPLPPNPYVYVVDAAGNALIEIDVAAGAVARRVAVGRTPEAVAVSPDGRTVTVANARSGDLSLVDVVSFTERARVPVPGAPVRAVYSPDGRTLAVSLSDTGRVALLDPEGRLRATVEVGARPDGLAFSRDGRLLYVALSGDHRVAVVSLSGRRVARMIETGEGPSGLLLQD